jgi:hypothetical protein
MNFQLPVVALLVALSFVYAAWSLMPQALRALAARALLRLPLPGFVRQRVLAASRASAGCGCSGCDKAPAAAPGNGSGMLTGHAQPLVFHRRIKR